MDFPRWFRVSLAGLLVLACLHAFHVSVLTKELTTGDEGVNATMSLNMIRDTSFIVRPSYIPAGSGDWADGDFRQIANTPFHSFVLSLAARLTRDPVVGMGVLHFLLFAGTVVFLYQFLALWHRDLALLAVVLFSLSAEVIVEFSTIEMEPMLTFFGVASLYFVANGVTAQKPWVCVVGGVCLGLAFLAKLWLFVPYVFAIGGFLLGHLWKTSWRVPGRFMYSMLLLVVGFFGAAAAHLLTVLLFSPSDIGLWLRNVYLSVFLETGIQGTKLTGTGVAPGWSHPFWYYPVILYRDHFYLLPILLAGLTVCVWRALAETSVRESRLSSLVLVLLAGIGGLVPLSLPAIKEPLYILSTLPFIYALSALALLTLIEEAGAPRASEAFRPMLWASLPVIGALLAGILMAYRLHLKTDDITPRFTLIHSSFAGLYLGVVVWLLAQRSGRAFAGVVTVVGGLVLAVQFLTTTTTTEPYRDIAAIVKPHLAGVRPSQQAVVAPNYKVFQFYLFQYGRYWESFFVKTDLEELRSNSQYRVYILGPMETANPGVQQLLPWLVANCRVTEVSPAATTDSNAVWKVFVRR